MLLIDITGDQSDAELIKLILDGIVDGGWKIKRFFGVVVGQAETGGAV